MHNIAGAFHSANDVPSLLLCPVTRKTTEDVLISELCLKEQVYSMTGMLEIWQTICGNRNNDANSCSFIKKGIWNVCSIRIIKTQLSHLFLLLSNKLPFFPLFLSLYSTSIFVNWKKWGPNISIFSYVAMINPQTPSWIWAWQTSCSFLINKI